MKFHFRSFSKFSKQYNVKDIFSDKTFTLISREKDIPANFRRKETQIDAEENQNKKISDNQRSNQRKSAGEKDTPADDRRIESELKTPPFHFS